MCILYIINRVLACLRYSKVKVKIEVRVRLTEIEEKSCCVYRYFVKKS